MTSKTIRGSCAYGPGLEKQTKIVLGYAIASTIVACTFFFEAIGGDEHPLYDYNSINIQKEGKSLLQTNRTQESRHKEN